MQDLSPDAKGFAITLAGVLVLSPDALLVRLVGADDWTIIVYRSAFTALALIAFIAVRRRSAIIDEFRRMDWQAVVAGLLYGVGNICFVQSVGHTLVANTLVILAATPLIAAVLSHLLLGEQQRRETWIAILVVLGGIGTIFAGSVGGGYLVGDLFALGAATAMAGNLTVLRRSRVDSPLPAVVLGGLCAAAVAAPFAAPMTVSAVDVAVLIVNGAVVMPVAFGLIFIGPRYLPAPEVALVMLLEAILGPLMVWLALSEQPPVRIILAGAVIVGTVAVHSLISLRRSGRARSFPPK